MGTFVTAYLIIWLAIGCYVAWLGVQQHRLAREMQELRARMVEDETLEEVPSKAA